MTTNHNNTYRISIWPLFWLNAMAFAIISGVCVVFLLSLESQGLSQNEVRLIVGYFMGIGFLIAIAGGIFGWLGGPEVTLTQEGISVRTTWLMDKTFPERREFTIHWADITAAEKTRFWTMPYAKLLRDKGNDIKTEDNRPFYLPLFVMGRQSFVAQIKQLGANNTALSQFVAQNL